MLASYAGPVAVMSFDPDQVTAIRQIAPGLPRGMIAQRRYDDWDELLPADRRRLAWFVHVNRTRPHFIAYRVGDLPAVLPLIARKLFGLPLLTWTVRTAEDRRRAARWADQIIFEGLRP